jgi:hypothetical protein
VTVVLSILLVLSAGLSAAQGPAPQGQVLPQAVVGTAFTYQGELRKDGNPLTATCAMTFTLYDDPAAGNLVGTAIYPAVAIDGGLFTVALDFGPNSFTGDGRWLEIAVQCPGDAGFSTLAPRQALTAAPYALSLRPGATISGTVSGNTLSAINSVPNFPAVGVYGESRSIFYGYGVYGYAPASSGWAVGVAGETESPNGAGVVGWGPNEGVYGLAQADSGETYGVYGQADSTAGRGVYGLATAASGSAYGVYGEADSTAGRGVYGLATAASGSAYGVYGEADSTAGRGVYGLATAASGTTYGVYGQTSSTDGYGVGGTGPVMGVYGRASAASGTTSGAYGRSDSTAGRGTVGWATAASGDARGVYGRSDSSAGIGVYGLATAASGTTYGVYGQMSSEYGAGVYGYAPAATTSTRVGVKGESWADQGRGVYGVANGTTAAADGVLGESYYGLANGVAGIVWTTTGTGIGVFGQTHSPSGYAGYFSGNVHVNGTLTAVSKLFRIDHPLDPANRYLYHYSVESAEVLNQYSGNVVLGADGSAWVELPAWFGAINQDVRYQLTPVGAAAPGLYIAQEVHDNRFQVAGGPPGLKVSWLITAVRSDPYIQRYGAPVEVEKPAEERGTYLRPELYGQPEELGLDYRFTQGRPAPAEAELPAAEELP